MRRLLNALLLAACAPAAAAAGASVQIANNNGTVFPRLPCSVGFIGAEPGCDLTQASPFAVQQGNVIDAVELVMPLPDPLFSDSLDF